MTTSKMRGLNASPLRIHRLSGSATQPPPNEVSGLELRARGVRAIIATFADTGYRRRRIQADQSG